MRCYRIEITPQKLITIALLSALLTPIANAADKTAYPVAGVNPHQRPDNAPLISEVTKDDDWYKNALQGVDAPYPANLKFLEDQGNWFTPFTRPGMTGPYDIRHWHSE